MQYSSVPKLACVWISAAIALFGLSTAAWALPSAVMTPGTPTNPAGQTVADANPASPKQETAGSDAAQSHNAARSRMRECGHQWSAMKKSGSAAGITWKDFSQGCLAKQ